MEKNPPLLFRFISTGWRVADVRPKTLNRFPTLGTAAPTTPFLEKMMEPHNPYLELVGSQQSIDLQICEKMSFYDQTDVTMTSIAKVRGPADTIWKSLVEFKRQLGNARLDRFSVIVNLVGKKAAIHVPFQDFWRVNILQGLQRAAERREVHCHFQPIMITKPTLGTFGFELLVRYADEDEFVLTPREIFSLAIDFESELYIQKIVFGACLENLNKIQTNQRAFVNLNPELFFRGYFCWRQFLEALKAAELHPNQIVLEIVEASHVYDPKRLIEFASDCRGYGVHVAVDDLGSQNRGIEVLNAIRPDLVKLEMEIVRGCAADPYRRRLVEGLIKTCHSLNVGIVLEGIENAVDHRWQMSTQAQLAQGYYYSKPLVRPEYVLATERHLNVEAPRYDQRHALPLPAFGPVQTELFSAVEI